MKNLGMVWLWASGFYLTPVALVSPVYFFYALSLFAIYLYSTYCPEKVKVSPVILALFFMALILTGIQAAYVKVNISLNTLMFMTAPIVVWIFFRYSTIKEKHINLIFFFYILLFVWDGIYRLLNPNLDNYEAWLERDILFYMFKSSSLMYDDSNFLGLQALVLYCFLRFLNLNRYCESKLLLVGLLAGLFLSFSRSAIISVALCELVYFCISSKNKLARQLFIFLLSFCLIIFVYLVLSIFANDASFNSKFNIIKLAIYSYKELDMIDRFIGVGFGNVVNYIGIGAHNFYVSAIYEGGVIFVMWMTLFLCYVFYKTGIQFLVLIFPVLVAFFSLGTIAMPYLTTVATLAVLVVRGVTVIERSRYVSHPGRLTQAQISIATPGAR